MREKKLKKNPESKKPQKKRVRTQMPDNFFVYFRRLSKADEFELESRQRFLAALDFFCLFSQAYEFELESRQYF